MTLHRFYIPPADWDPAQLALDEAESRHAADVLRLREGDRLAVFNGAGQEALVRIHQPTKRRTPLVLASLTHTPAPSVKLLLAQAIPKGKNMDLLLQKATELGATGIWPILTERTVVRMDAAEATEKREKWQRMVVEACKQCGQNHLPPVHLPQSLRQFLTHLPAADLPVIAALTPQARPLHQLLDASSPRPQSALILIGPEGDFTPAELAAAEAAHFLPLSLGPLVLRTETAGIYALSVLGYELGKQASAGSPLRP